MNRRVKLTLQIGCLVILMAASAVAAGWWARRRSLHELSQQAREHLQLRAASLQRLVDRYRVLPSTLALDPELRAALRHPAAQIDTDALNRKLERTNGATHVSTLTLIDRRGIAVAASNWREPSSNVGRHYAFRPYFQRAMHSGLGTFYAVGISTNVAGYFIAQAIHDDTGKPIGVIVVKITLQQILGEWAAARDTILLADKHGIVFLSNRSSWQYRPLQSIGHAVATRLASTRQYSNRLRAQAQLHVERRLEDGGSVLNVGFPGSSRTVLARSIRLPAQGWTLYSLTSTHRVVAAIQHAVLITLGGWLPIILFGLFLRQRMHLATVRQRSREELERLVAHYTSALRSEKNSLVQAAVNAARGNMASLEHLPQGVSVIDSELRLVAWNSRYAQIFDFPAHLLEIGRPIEDLLRYNAERGLLGPGHEEHAILRRLTFLRNGSPHMYERERPDGSVLEIRGHPMPGGGFVTSYADITPYKKAARALRTLTSTLERRVEKSTKELRLAKAEAERANRNKTRYVAAAVHDLLQPLNAARLFSGALRKVLGPADHATLDRVEQALLALDGQLGSMLDLSRLEAGAIQPQIEAVELAPLLQSLARQFGIIAQARNLDLHLVSSRAWVRSDAALLRRILQNFLSNALHYTPRGKVLIGCRRLGPRLRIEVWDTGVGIPADKRETIFREFARLDTGMDTDERSAGLGLSIVERIAGLLGHPLMLDSWPEHGSVFGVELPRVQAPDNPSAAPIALTCSDDSESPLAGRHILCVEDDRAGADALAALLGSWSCTVQVAHDADALRGIEMPCIDLVLLDYRLGSVCGLDLLPELCTRLGYQPPVIILTAHTDSEIRRHVSEAGLRFLAKPASPARLRALMSQLLIAADTV